QGDTGIATVFRGVSLPMVIDTDMADTFNQLQPDDLESLLRDKLSPAEVDAAKQRLQGIKGHINFLRTINLVIAPTDWGNPIVTDAPTRGDSYAVRDKRLKRPA